MREVVARSVIMPRVSRRRVSRRRVVARWVGVRWMGMRWVATVRMGFGGEGKPEAQAVQASASARLEHRGAGTRRQHRGRVRQHAGPKVRQGVNHGGGEHVSRHATYRVEANREAHSPAKTGTT